MARPLIYDRAVSIKVTPAQLEALRLAAFANVAQFVRTATMLALKRADLLLPGDIDVSRPERKPLDPARGFREHIMVRLTAAQYAVVQVVAERRGNSVGHVMRGAALKAADVKIRAKRPKGTRGRRAGDPWRAPAVDA